uniref:Uncharacterized protein n=1 Tax=Anguilla anguilla TaxID=7936 RepID=A0A0E9X6R9_ANGAN
MFTFTFHPFPNFLVSPPPPSKWGIKKRVKFLLPLSKTNLEFILIYLLFFPLFAVHTSPSFTGWSGQVFPLSTYNKMDSLYLNTMF